MSEVQILPGVLQARLHVDSSRRRSTVDAMTGVARLVSRSGSGIRSVSKIDRVGFNSLTACYVVLASRCTTRRGSTRTLGESPGDHAFALTAGQTIVSYAMRRRVQISPARRKFSRCGSTWLERCVRDAEIGGSNPLASTIRRTVHLAVIAGLHPARAGSDSLVLYETKLAESFRSETFPLHSR